MIFRSGRKMKILTFLILGFASAAFAEDFKQLTGKNTRTSGLAGSNPTALC